MSLVRAALTLVVVLAVACGAGAAGARTKADAPGGLHAFLLRADEPAKTSFPRTPAFGWSPYPTATGYEFQLSISDTFRDNGILWQCPSDACPALTTPVAAPTLSLPWITGSPHSLYARVRAVLPDGSKTDWSDAYGFDMEPPAPPRPLPSTPGLLRWTPVPGANGYQVWLVDARVKGTPKMETVYSNVLDERDFYTFHESQSWIGSVRWRIRALRDDWGGRVNGIPATKYGAWSPVYRSTNPPPTSGPIHLGSTVSDVVMSGASGDLAHRLPPAFTWTGDEALDGTRAELFRVYVFTDRQCLNRVFTGSVVGSPAYAARPYGALALPSDNAPDRGTYLADMSGPQPGLTSDEEQVPSTEGGDPAAPTTSLPGTGGGSATPTDDGASSGGSSTAKAAGTANANRGAPTSFWDDDWPRGGYYWTVIPVATVSTGSTATLAAAAPKGSTTVVVSGGGLEPGAKVQVGTGPTTEILTIDTVSGSVVTFKSATLNDHAAGEPIAAPGSDVVYQDLEMAQDACAAGRVARFGISSEPAVATGDAPFVSGLSQQGKLSSATRSASFYEAPLVSWTPALGASVYQLQWSKKAKPFTPEQGPDGGAGVMTPATSYVLPLEPGTWYYRVRGFDWSLPTGAQQMAWSDVAKVEITKPTFQVVERSTVKKSKRRK